MGAQILTGSINCELPTHGQPFTNSKASLSGSVVMIMECKNVLLRTVGNLNSQTYAGAMGLPEPGLNPVTSIV